MITYKTKSKKTVSQLLRAISNDGSGVYTNDDGNGCAGPMYLDPQSIDQMIEDGAADDYQIVAKTHRGVCASKIIRETLDAHRHDQKCGTKWMLAEKVDDDGSNLYTHYLLLWEV